MRTKKNLVEKFIAVGRRMRNSYRKRVVKRRVGRLAESILRDMRKHPGRYSDPAIAEAVGYMRDHGVSVFPYPFTEKYDAAEIEVHTDDSVGLRYVMHHGRRLYMKRGATEAAAQGCYNSLRMEQDPQSPHSYSSGGFGLQAGDVLFDIGSAEGNFALENVEKASRVFLLEVEESWCEALRKTFEPWKDKVTIVNKFASDRDDGRRIAIDTLVREYGITAPVFIKMDVEGAEASVLRGAKETLARRDTKAVICTYHRQEDHAVLSQAMESDGYSVETSPGHMLFIFDDKALKPPYFRRGVIYCSKPAAGKP